MVITYSKGKDQPGKVANPSRGQLGKMIFSLSPFAPENLVSLDGFSRPVPRQPAHLYAQAESGAYLRDPSRVPRRGVTTYRLFSRFCFSLIVVWQAVVFILGVILGVI